MPTLTFDLPQEDEENLMLLKESDFISFFDQFPFSEMFKHILGIGESGTKHWECYFIVVCIHCVLLQGKFPLPRRPATRCSD